MRVVLGIEYCGSSYCGWQRQGVFDNSVQQYVEEALSRLAKQPIKVCCAGRTDAGVHALCQVVHFETEAERTAYSWVVGSNANLPDDISVLWSKVVDNNFHARFSAVSRVYKYIIINRPAKPGTYRRFVTWEHRKLDEARMSTAAKSLLGRHDFTSFRASACQAKSPVRDIKSVNLYRSNDYVIFSIEADGFLHNMVRNIVGILIEIGCGKADVSWVGELLTLRNRTKAGKTAAPDGLYLAKVYYPEIYGIPVPIDSQYLPLL